MASTTHTVATDSIVHPEITTTVPTAVLIGYHLPAPGYKVSFSKRPTRGEFCAASLVKKPKQSFFIPEAILEASPPTHLSRSQGGLSFLRAMRQDIHLQKSSGDLQTWVRSLPRHRYHDTRAICEYQTHHMQHGMNPGARHHCRSQTVWHDYFERWSARVKEYGSGKREGTGLGLPLGGKKILYFALSLILNRRDSYIKRFRFRHSGEDKRKKMS